MIDEHEEFLAALNILLKLASVNQNTAEVAAECAERITHYVDTLIKDAKYWRESSG